MAIDRFMVGVFHNFGIPFLSPSRVKIAEALLYYLNSLFDLTLIAIR